MAILGLVLCLAHCGHYQYEVSPAPSWNPPPLANPRLEAQQHLIVPPLVPGLRHYRVGVPLFRCLAHLPDVPYPITSIFYRQLLEKRPFQEVVLIPQFYADLDHAISLAQEYKVDLILLGAIPYFLDGGGLGKSGIQVDVKLVEAKSKHILWYMTDAISATQRPIIDLWVTETRPNPNPGIYTLAERLAQRIVGTLQAEVVVPAKAKNTRQTQANEG